MQELVFPGYYMVVKAEVRGWGFYEGDLFYNPSSEEISLDPEELLDRFGSNMSQIVLELFQVNGGRHGYYLANLRDKKYYYCGEGEDSVKDKLLELGIGRADPTDAN